MYDIPFDRSFLQLSNGIRYVMPSTDRKLELTAKASMAQPVSQPAVYCNGLTFSEIHSRWETGRGAYRVIVGEPEGNRHLEDKPVEGKITLKLIFKKW